MKRFAIITKLLGISLILAAAGGAAAATAADLRNEDGRRYEVKVHETSTTRNTSIDGNSTMLGVCSSCEIEVVGVGRIKVSGSERAVIKNGRLTKQ